MIDLKQFSGIMDTDSPNETIGQGSIKMGRNIRYRGEKGNWRIENIEGNTLIPYNQPAGVNECIGGFYDELRQRIYEFIYNSNGTHSIRITYLNNLNRISLLTNGTNADSDCLEFTLDGKITAVQMLYGDSEQGDTIYFNNSNDEPCQINIERTLAGTYGTMKRSFLDVIKYPANRPPYVTYGDDNTVTVNTLRKKLFRFMTRPVYFSREKSVTSIRSELCLPINAADTAVDKDPTKNCKISIVYETLDADVEAIEIIGQVSGKTDENGVVDPNAFGDPFLITTINKAASSLGNNDIATFVFKNDQAYTEIDPQDAVQLFDLVPLTAEALEMLNGNVLIYGNITEGFDLTTMIATVTASAIPRIDTQLPYIFVGSQTGDSAFGTGNIHIVVIGTIGVGYTFTFTTTTKTVTFVSAGTTTAAIIAGLAAAAIVQGFTVVSSDTENLVVTQTGESLQVVVRQAPILAVTNGFAYNWNDKGAFCVNYWDAAGRGAGSETIQAMSYSTLNYTESGGIPNITQLLLSITNRPPLSARYFTLGRTDSLAKLKFLYWVSDITYKDTEFAWISIENLNTFINNNKPNSAHLAYDFSPGDRIRFIKVLSGSVNTVYTNQDFTIIGQELSPKINGIERPGQFIKISLPTTSGTFDFGTSAFYNYEIELYTPAQSVANSLNKFYEFGERYTIGNPGTATRYHQGMTQNQTPNLSQAATFTLNKGQYYYRNRTINVGAEYNYEITPYEQGIGRTTLYLTFLNQTSTDPAITPGSSPNADLSAFVLASNTDRAILNITSGTYNFRIKGSISVSFNDFGEIFSYYLIDSNSNVIYLVAPTGFTGITQGPHTFEFDVTFALTGPVRLFIFAYSGGDFTNSKSYANSTMKITRQLPYTVPIIDANYSDYFASAVNSDARPTIEQPSSARSNNPQLLRWSRSNIINTNINEISRFTVLNFDEIDGVKGGIKKLSSENRILNVLQERGCAWYAIYAKVLQNNAGENVITTTDEIITKNNIQYLSGTYGIGDNVASFAKTKLGYFFDDSIRGYELRRSVDGLTPINEIFFGQYTIRDIITKYNDGYTRPNGALSIILGYYDYFEEAFVKFCQAGTYNGNTIPNNNFSFSDNAGRKGYVTFFDYNPEWIICAQDTTFSWKSGQIYIHNNKTNYGKFYEEQTYPSVTLVFNDKEAVKKVFDALAYQSNQIWEATIKTSMVNPQTGLRQESVLIAQDYEITDNIRYAGLLRDLNSMADAREALLEGDYLNGNWIEVTLTYKGSDFCFLYLPYISYQPNQRNF